MTEVDYIISLFPAKWDGYQSKRGTKGIVKAFVSNIWKLAQEDGMKFKEDIFDLFVDYLNFIFINERYCLERAFQKIRIKGGMCNPCCVSSLVSNTVEYLYGLEFEVK